MTLFVSKRPDETWRDAVIRHARPYGLETECLEIFDQDVAAGKEEGEAAWNACYEWDVCQLYEAVVGTDHDKRKGNGKKGTPV